MENQFVTMMLLDNATGRVVGTDVRIERGDTFVFVASKDSGRPFLSSEVPPPKKEAFLEFSRLRGNAVTCQKKKKDISLDDLLVDQLFSFAEEHGPLFGFAGLREQPSDEFVIRESIADWKTAQRVMELSLKAEVFSRGVELEYEELDKHFWIELVNIPGQEFSWEYVFDTGAVASDAYRTCLKGDFFHGFTTDDNSILCAKWMASESPNPDVLLKSGHMIARFATRYPAEHFEMLPIPKSERIPLSDMQGKVDIEDEVASLLKIVADRHVGGVSLGFRNYLSACNTKAEGEYGILCSNYLSYMWHEFAQAYTRSSFRVCANPKCENIISINDETSSSKRFCSERCRVQANNKKISEQNTRAREAFYACKYYDEIYEAAFGKPLSFKDPERGKLHKRLNNWIEEDFSKTAKGKAALKQGAARER